MIGLLLAAAVAANAGSDVLRVCEDPNNLPFSNRDGGGFENKIVERVAADLGKQVRYTWWAQRRGYVRNTLGAQDCDVWPGVATGLDMLLTTRPYYRSSYVFVSRADRTLGLELLDDPRLHQLRIGVQMVGNDAQNTPPAHALAQRGVTDNVRGFMVYGDYRRANPPAEIIDAVTDGSLDTAVVWGPVAGYFAARAARPLVLEPVEPQSDGPQFPMVFDISMGVRRGDHDLKQTLDHELVKLKPEITAILAAYHVPTV